MAIRTPMKAIRAKCLDCCCGQINEVRLCECVDCPLWEYRSGHRPKKDGSTPTEEETENLDEEI